MLGPKSTTRVEKTGDEGYCTYFLYLITKGPKESLCTQSQTFPFIVIRKNPRATTVVVATNKQQLADSVINIDTKLLVPGNQRQEAWRLVARSCPECRREQ